MQKTQQKLHKSCLYDDRVVEQFREVRECSGRQAGEGRCDGHKGRASLSFCRLDLQ